MSIVRLLPDLPVQGSLLRGLQAFAAAIHARAEAEPRRASRRRGAKTALSFPVELVASQVQIDRRDMYVICLRDISERLATEQALRDSETRYRTLVESAPEVIVVIDAHTGRCTDANENALQFFGIKRAQGQRAGTCAICCGRREFSSASAAGAGRLSAAAAQYSNGVIAAATGKS